MNQLARLKPVTRLKLLIKIVQAELGGVVLSRPNAVEKLPLLLNESKGRKEYRCLARS